MAYATLFFYMKKFIQACLEANKELKNYIDTELTKEDLEYGGTIGYGGDNSLNIDLKAEQIFIDHLLPFGDIYSEERGLIKSNSTLKIKNSTFIIDPLDGSDNFLSDLKYYGTSVALQIDGITKLGVVYNLVNGTYIAKDMDGKIYTNKREVTNSKIGIFERAYKFPEICQKFYDKNIKYRSPGAVALSLADARNYNFVLFGGSMRTFDLEASLYINSDLYIYKSDKFLLLCKNIQIFEKIKNIL